MLGVPIALLEAKGTKAVARGRRSTSRAEPRAIETMLSLSSWIAGARSEPRRRDGGSLRRHPARHGAFALDGATTGGATANAATTRAAGAVAPRCGASQRTFAA